MNLLFLFPNVWMIPLTSVTHMFGPCTLTNVLWPAEKAMLHSVDLHCFDSPTNCFSGLHTLSSVASASALGRHPRGGP